MTKFSKNLGGGMAALAPPGYACVFLYYFSEQSA